MLVCAPIFLYYIFAGLIYGCIATVCILAAVFGGRAMRNVKRERVAELKNGFSPLDVQRIFIGKTYPAMLTRALIVQWAERGLISVEQIDRSHVKLRKLRGMPVHDSERAVFFDRGTYVRERALYDKVFGKLKEKTVNIYLPLISRYAWKEINKGFAVREDDGVYSSTHYALKVLTTCLSLAPMFFAAIWFTLDGFGAAVILPLIAMLGFFVLRFMREIPLWFRLIWCSLWLGVPVIGMVAFGKDCYDPWGIGYAADIIMFLGSFLLIQFVDYREKNNLSDYSDLVNYRKFLWRAGSNEVDYYKALPFLYAFRIKPFVSRRLKPDKLPDWYSCRDGVKGGLL